jgi:anti-sigma regulatory factor (Ser/Thr protein kinase)
MDTMSLSPDPSVRGFRHEALFYSGVGGFLGGVLPFIREGVRAGEDVLVVVGAPKIGLLRSRLNGEASAVRFADMAEIGGNPARIIPAWREFVKAGTSMSRPFRGVGEPVYPERNADELAECQLHESLLNLAFDGGPAWRLLCPYDAETLGGDVLDEARRTHPFVWQDGDERLSERYLSSAGPSLDLPLPEPRTGAVHVLEFDGGSLRRVRRFVAEHARLAVLSPERVDEVVLAVNEVTTNTVRHGGGRGTLRLWLQGDVLVVEVRDRGSIGDPLVGRGAPALQQEGGRGLWLVNQLCDLVQLRSSTKGAAVRLHVRGARAHVV